MIKKTFWRNQALLIAFVFLLTTAGPSVFAATTGVRITADSQPAYTAGNTNSTGFKLLTVTVTVPPGTTTEQAIVLKISSASKGTADKFFLTTDTAIKSVIASERQELVLNIPVPTGKDPWRAKAHLGITSGSALSAGESITVTATDMYAPHKEDAVSISVAKGGGTGGGTGGGNKPKPAPTDDKPKKPAPTKPDAGTGTGGQSGRFNDVKPGDWFYDDVEHVVKNGLFTGVSSSEFGPRAPMTRGMVVTVLGRLHGASTSAYASSSFRDVAAGQYYAAYIEWAKANGIVNGIGDNLFAPDMEVSRQDFAVILLRYAEFAEKTLPATRKPVTFSDEAKISAYAKNAIQTLYAGEIIYGVGKNAVSPDESATRAEVAAMLHRFVKATKK